MFQNIVRMFLCLRSVIHCFQCFVCGASRSGKVLSHGPPPPTPQKLLPLNPPSPSEFPMIFHGGGGGVWIFSETTRSFLQYLVCIALSPANLISSCVSGCKDAKKVSFTAGHSRSCNYHVSGSYVCKKFPS